MEFISEGWSTKTSKEEKNEEKWAKKSEKLIARVLAVDLF